MLLGQVSACRLVTFRADDATPCVRHRDRRNRAGLLVDVEGQRAPYLRGAGRRDCAEPGPALLPRPGAGEFSPLHRRWRQIREQAGRAVAGPGLWHYAAGDLSADAALG